MIDDAVPKSRSPTRMAVELPYFALALGAPRRTSASSMTSSWHSEARWVSSTPAAAATTSSLMPVAELGRQQGQQRPEPLAAGLDEVDVGLGDERVVVVDLAAQQRVDLDQAVAAAARISRGRRPMGSADAPEGSRGHRTKNCDDRSARSRTWAGRTPRTQRHERADGDRDRRARRRRLGHDASPPGGLGEVHEHDQPDVDERRDHAAEHTDDDQGHARAPAERDGRARTRHTSR